MSAPGRWQDAARAVMALEQAGSESPLPATAAGAAMAKSYAGDSCGENDRQVLPGGSDQTRHQRNATLRGPLIGAHVRRPITE